MKFDQYHFAPEIKRSLEDLGFRRPTDIQYTAMPSILKGDDVWACAQTGTGKTAAFVLPIIHKLHRQKTISKRKEVKCLVMVPTRELAVQIADVFKTIGKYTKVQILGLFGGVDQDPQVARLAQGVDVLIATPGRMYDLLNQKYIDLGKVQILVLDEADHMLDLGFNKDIKGVLGHLPRAHQTLFFSATINATIKDLAYEIVHNPIRIQISPKDPVSKNVSHSLVFVGMDDKRFFLERIVREQAEAKILVFVRTKVRAERVVKAMERVGIEAVAMHGNVEQDDRLAIMKTFKEGSARLLVTTDVNARGIDIPDVDIVINYDLPEVAENYVHRVGRTGRGVKRGRALAFCSPEEKPMLAAIENYMGKTIHVLELDKGTYFETVQLSEDTPNDNWKLLLATHEAAEKQLKRKKKK